MAVNGSLRRVLTGTEDCAGEYNVRLHLSRIYLQAMDRHSFPQKYGDRVIVIILSIVIVLEESGYYCNSRRCRVILPWIIQRRRRVKLNKTKKKLVSNKKIFGKFLKYIYTYINSYICAYSFKTVDQFNLIQFLLHLGVWKSFQVVHTNTQ